MIDLTVIIPVFNEEESILPLLNEVREVIDKNSYKAEILCINDGSTDNTEKILTEYRNKYPILQIYTFEKNAGQSAAMACGFVKAQGDYIITIDGDGQNDPADIPKIVELLEEYQVVCGVRKNRKDTLSKRWGSKLAKFDPSSYYRRHNYRYRMFS